MLGGPGESQWGEMVGTSNWQADLPSYNVGSSPGLIVLSVNVLPSSPDSLTELVCVRACVILRCQSCQPSILNQCLSIGHIGQGSTEDPRLMELLASPYFLQGCQPVQQDTEQKCITLTSSHSFALTPDDDFTSLVFNHI